MTPQATLALRAAIFAAVMLWMQAGPVAVQVLGLPRPPGTMAWQMYGTRGHRLCAVQWFTRAQDGTLAPLDRGIVPEQRLVGEDGVRRASGNLCRKLGFGTDLRARARCGTSGGWEQVMDLEQDLCNPW